MFKVCLTLEYHLRVEFFVPLLDSVINSIKTRVDKQSTAFMTQIAAFSPDNWGSDASKQAIRSLATDYDLHSYSVLTQYSLLSQYSLPTLWLQFA